MKQLLLLFGLFTWGATSGYSQQVPGKLQVGLVAGLGKSFDKGSEPNMRDVQPDIGGTTGFTVQYQLKRFFLKTELLYNNKRLQYNAGKQLGPLEDCWGPGCQDMLFEHYNAGSTEYHQVILPVLLGVYIKQTGFFVNAGPSIVLSNWATRHSEWYGARSYWAGQDVGFIGNLGYTGTISPSVAISAEFRHNYAYNLYTNSLLFGIQYTVSKK
jgi:hypothetical protein